jgi:hypothetical protein
MTTMFLVAVALSWSALALALVVLHREVTP